MGTKRPTKTTKSGRYMNPTDQARKEARRKELKKNKKQRMAVRQAVLKGKDPLVLVKLVDCILSNLIFPNGFMKQKCRYFRARFM